MEEKRKNILRQKFIENYNMEMIALDKLSEEEKEKYY